MKNEENATFQLKNITSKPFFWVITLQIRLNAFSLRYIDKIDHNMAGGNNDYGRKGGCVGKGALFLALFIIMLIWIYYKNQNGVPG